MKLSVSKLSSSSSNNELIIGYSGKTTQNAERVTTSILRRETDSHYKTQFYQWKIAVHAVKLEGIFKYESCFTTFRS